MSLDWANPNPLDARYFDWILAEYYKRRPYVIDLFDGDSTARPTSSLYYLIPGGESVVSEDYSGSDKDYRWVINKTTGEILQNPKWTNYLLQRSNSPIPGLGTGYQQRSNVSEDVFTRKLLRDLDWKNLYLLITTGLYGQSYGLLGPSQLYDSLLPYGAGRYGYLCTCGAVDTEQEIEGSRFIPNYWNCREGQPIAPCIYQRRMSWSAPEYQAGQFIPVSPWNTPENCIWHQPPFNHPVELFRQGMKTVGGVSQVVGSSTLVDQLELDISSGGGKWEGAVSLMKACYAILQKLTSFYSVWNMGPWSSLRTGKIACVYRTGTYHSDNPGAPVWNSYSTYETDAVNTFIDGALNCLDSTTTGPDATHIGSGYLYGNYARAMWNNENMEYYTQGKLHLKTMMYHIFNPTPYPVKVDIYMKAISSSASEVYDMNPQYPGEPSPASLKTDGSLFARDGLFHKIEGLSTTVGARSSQHVIWDCDTVVECDAPPPSYPKQSIAAFPFMCGLVAVYTPDFSSDEEG